jgi:hypothetical protein
MVERGGSPDLSISALCREGDSRGRAFLSPHMSPGGQFRPWPPEAFGTAAAAFAMQ